MLKHALLAVIMVAAALAVTRPAQAQTTGPVYELRIYTAPEGKLDSLLARFRDHSIRLLAKHGMESVGYWVPTDAPKSQNTLYYILKHKSRAGAAGSWAAFFKDPDWIKVQTASEANGKIVEKSESIFMSPTDFSNLK